MDYKIIVDSCCDMTPQLKERLSVTTVPLTMRLGKMEFHDDDALDLNHFMAEMKACTDKVCSASPAPYLYQQAMENAQHSFVVTLSSKLSGSYASAVMGKSLAESSGEIQTHVFDSKSASAGEVLVAIKIRELIQSGVSRSHIIQRVDQFIDNMKTYFVLENYDNLIKNGRLSKVKEKMIRILNIKLVMGSDGNGNIALHEKSRGIRQMIEKLVSFIEASGRTTESENLVISHCHNPAVVEQLCDAIRRRFQFKEIFIVPTLGISSLYADEKGFVIAF